MHLLVYTGQVSWRLKQTFLRVGVLNNLNTTDMNIWNTCRNKRLLLDFLLEASIDPCRSEGNISLTFPFLIKKRADFNFHFTNCPFLSRNAYIPSSHTYGVFVSQLVRYTRTCSRYECFIYFEGHATFQ